MFRQFSFYVTKCSASEHCKVTPHLDFVFKGNNGSINDCMIAPNPDWSSLSERRKRRLSTMLGYQVCHPQNGGQIGIYTCTLYTTA